MHMVMFDTITKIYNIFDKKDKMALRAVLILTVLVNVIDVIGIASFVPFIAVASDINLINSNKILNYIYLHLRYEDVNSFVMHYGICVLSIFLLSTSLKALSYYRQVDFALSQEAKISSQLINNYINNTYEWFYDKDRSILGSKVLSEVSVLVNNLMLPAIFLISQISSALFLIALLLIFDTSSTIVGGILFIASYYLIYKSIRGKITKYGKMRAKANEQRFFISSEIFNNIKEIKIRGFEETATNEYLSEALKFSKSLTIIAILNNIPKYLIEIIAFGTLLILILIELNNVNSGGDFVATLSLFGFAAYRLLPAFQQIYSSITQIKFNSVVIDSIFNDIKSSSNASLPMHDFIYNAPSQGGNLTIDLCGIKYKYPYSSKYAINNIKINIPNGAKIGIIGASGSGKSTLVDIVLGLITDYEGKILINSQEVYPVSASSYRDIIGYVPQSIVMMNGTIAQNIAFDKNMGNIDAKRIAKVCDLAKVNAFIKDEFSLYERPIGDSGIKLSGGQRQRIGIARALYRQPKLLLLDEATSALDVDTEANLIDDIYSMDTEMTIISVAHRLDALKYCDVIYVLDDGKIVSVASYEGLCQKMK